MIPDQRLQAYNKEISLFRRHEIKNMFFSLILLSLTSAEMHLFSEIKQQLNALEPSWAEKEHLSIFKL